MDKNIFYYSPSTGGFYVTEIHGNDVPEDVIEISNELRESLLAGQSIGKIITPPDEEHELPYLADLPPLTEEEQLKRLEKQFIDAIQKRLDDFANTRGYDNALACSSYATSTNPQFAMEAAYIIKARDETWTKGYEILNEVMSGHRDIPTWEEVEYELPKLEWPEDINT